MRYRKFVIQNYKGIKNLELDLDMSPDHKIYSLIGLNESGKTTILEAINDFEFEVPDDKKHLLIPKSELGGFTGDVLVKAELEVSEEDKKKIKDFLSKKMSFSELKILPTFNLTRTYTFNNSDFRKTGRVYTIFVTHKKAKRSKKFVNVEDKIEKELWQFVKDNLFPEIIFYKDFLSKFPEKIFLEAQGKQEEEYLSIIKDVLGSINQSYSIESSLLDRLKNPNNSNRSSREAVENEIGAKISEVVFNAWNRTKKTSQKEIVVKAETEEGRHFLRLSLKQGQRTYAISERSLGFKWFFTFLLYTEFRKERIKTTGEILFLLDEPASNLHQTAQQSILKTFETIAEKSRLVYATHSHHLINSLWLGSSYIIKNSAIDYDDDFAFRETEIKAYKYKQFASEFPNQTSYFQPILDVLDYRPGMLENVPNIVITEGKFDYYTFRYFVEIILKKSVNFNFYPGHGATKLDLPIGLYESWARNYYVLLDSDKEGRTQKTRYIKEISSEDKIFTLEDIDQMFKNITTEGLFSDDEKLEISKEFNPSLNKFDKGAFNTGIQILLSQKIVPSYISKDTRNKFLKIINFFEKKF
ncbi:MAG: AAA family ATPase [Rickettsiales bacterium]|nr:AAA family ATPase [Rickettsiales bacterium]